MVDQSVFIDDTFVMAPTGLFIHPNIVIMNPQDDDTMPQDGEALEEATPATEVTATPEMEEAETSTEATADESADESAE